MLTVSDLPVSCNFYRLVLGMEVVKYGEDRTALAFGQQKFNLHQLGRELEPRAKAPTPGSADVCLITNVPMSDVLHHLEQCGVVVESGPVARAGASGGITSVYIRDPDGNLIEISNY